MSEPTKAVFLSYASQDAEAAKRIADALRAAGVEVWFDAEGGLEHGDEWDAKIRRQIKECVLFIAVISANTQAREEGYFRIEWELAAQRALGIASGVAFILPVVIDDTKEPAALVPDRFRSVQWTKLPGGNVAPDVLQRFLKLWSHRAGVLKQAAAEVASAGPGGSEAPRGPGPSRPVWPWLVLGVLALGVAYLVFKPRRSPEEIARIVADAQKLAAAVTPPAPAAAAEFPADPDLAKAMKLVETLNSTMEDHTLAEDLAKGVLARKPTDPETVIVNAYVANRFILRGFDVSEERHAAARRLCERALLLAPDHPEALHVMGQFLGFRGADLSRAVDLLHRAVTLQPDRARFYNSYIEALENNKDPDVVHIAAAAAARFPADPIIRYRLALVYAYVPGDLDAYERALDETIAIGPVATAVLRKVGVTLLVHRDIAAAQRLLDQVPESFRLNDRTVYARYLVASASGEVDDALRALNALPGNFLSDFGLWPKRMLTGDLLARKGQADLARRDYEAALADIARERARNPNVSFERPEKWLQFWLGREKEARASANLTYEAVRRPVALRGLTNMWFGPVTTLLVLGERAKALELLRESVSDDWGRRVMAGAFALDPHLATWRDDAEIKTILTEPAGTAAAAVAAPATNWPKDPDLKRAMKLLNSPEAIVSDVALAEDIVNTVLAARPTDAEATLAMGRVQVYYLLRGFDRSEDRFATAKRYAERALALTPDDPEAMAVMATYLYRRNVELPRAQKLIHQAIALRPSEPLYYRILANVLAATPDVSDAEIIASAKITAERFPSDALVQYELARHYRDAGMLAEAEHYLDVAIKLGPVANAIIARARLMLFAHGDPAGMKAILDQLPERYQGTDRAVFSRFSYALVTGQPQLGLDGLQALPEAWMIDFDYTGPTALLQGELLLLQGKTELARLRFTEALAELGRHKAILERNFATTWLETWLLMRLGRLDEARKRNDVFFPELGRPYRIGLGTNWWFNPITQNLLLGEHAKALELMREAAGGQQGRTVLRHALRLDPRMAPFRDDPEIKALLAEPVEKSAVAAPKGDDKSVAVLAFANLSDDKNNEYFSDGISEELLNVLAKVPRLKVAARTSSFYFKGQNVPIPEIAQKLGVAYVVEGSVRKAGDKVRITAQLIKAADGFHVWSETYDRELKDIFAVQDEIAKNILGVVKGSLLGEAELPHATTTKIEAYTFFLQAQGAFAKRGEANLRESIRLFEAALAIDPDYVPALVGLAQARVVLPNYAYLSGAKAREITDGAMQAARRALALDPQNAAAHAVIGWELFQFEWRWSEGLAEVLRARDLAPNDPWNWNCLGDYYRYVGDYPQALSAKQREWELDPLSPNSHWDLSYSNLVGGNYDQAIHWSEISVGLAPHNVDSYMPAILAAGRAGRLDLMRRTLAAARQNIHEGEGMLLLLGAYCAILEKKPDEAHRLLALAVPLAEGASASPSYLGYCYLLLGEAEQARIWLQRGYDRYDEALVWNEIIDFDVIAANPKTRPILDQPKLKELYELRQRNARAGLSKL